MVLRNHLAAFVLVMALQLTNALYFHIGETERKCFIEEIPDETTVIGKRSLARWHLLEGKLNCTFIYSKLQGRTVRSS